MILVEVIEEDGTEVVWDLPIKYAKTREHLLKRIHKMLREEYGDKIYKIKGALAPLGSKC